MTDIKTTIVAISAPVYGAISIIRLSGPLSLSIIKKVFKTRAKSFKSHRIYYGHIVSEAAIIDEVLVSIMLAPKTYTCEDIVEINCHGGAFVAQKILELLLDSGATLAEPGEFTKRAYLNGRIDLLQAEAVSDIINAKTEIALKLAHKQLAGNFGRGLNALCEVLLNLLAKIETNLDYPEYDDAEIVAGEIEAQIEEIIGRIELILANSKQGKIASQGIKTVIMGAANAGKSSLLNALLNEERAIVSPVAGTTRDILREYIRIGHSLLHISDTAGLREQPDEIEQIGINLANKEMVEADLLIYVIDGSNPVFPVPCTDPRMIFAINKSDLPQSIGYTALVDANPENIVKISAKNADITELTSKIKSLTNLSITETDEMLTNARHISILNQALNHLKQAQTALINGVFIDLVAIDLAACHSSLCEITGKNPIESLVDKIFAEFCLGK